jgi:AraC-like DNA-binding protein
MHDDRLPDLDLRAEDPAEAAALLAQHLHREYHLRVQDDFGFRMVGSGWRQTMVMSQLRYDGTVHVQAKQTRGYRAFEVQQGQFMNDRELLRPGATIMSTGPADATVEDFQARYVWVADSVMLDVLHTHGAESVRFRDERPVCPEAATLYRAAVNDLMALASLQWAGSQELVVYESTRRLAGVMLTVFPNDVVMHEGPRQLYGPSTAHTALEWIEAHLGEKLLVRDVAMAAGVSNRTVQAIFERRNTTFTDYVRERRLFRARHRWKAGEDTGVTAMAMSLGWSNPGRVSAEYAALFGELPSATRRKLRA